ncbi:MAG TPA: ABC-F family ATP-binding cassette domain-containing protein, partial [Egibacteraceae bacterium]|nr:ABC-F family ATP-binding cassette domain-containing protein [Egibacteraceae bacterium]
SKRHAEKQVLDEVTLGVDQRDRVGVIGRNGSGKSTLLRIVAGVLEADGGRVVTSDGLRVRYVPQEPEPDPRHTALEAALSAPADFDPLMDRAAVQREQRARSVLDRMGIDDVARRVAEMSGGQRKRVALAGALTDDTDLLILDEPTNHLDVDVVEWLEGELRSRSGALLLVTHDRYLLDRLATRIVEVEGGRLHTGHGSYAAYLQARAQRLQLEAAAEQRRANRARVELEWLRRGPKARTSKAKYRVERAHELLDAAPAQPAAELSIELPSRRLGSKIVNLHNAGKRYGDHVVLRGIDHKLKPGDRIGVVGPNGSGKTTLLRLVAGELEPDEGKVVIGETVHIGRYGQQPRALPPRQRVLDAVKDVVLETRTLEGRTMGAGALLEQFLFAPQAQRAFVEELSGGERRRLELLLVLAEAPNVLLLDEPTNDLDLDTLAVLEEYLDAWPGVLVVASHDRYFLDRVCTDLFSVQPDGTIRHHPGGWSDWREHQRQQRQRPTPAPDTPRDQRPATRVRKLTYGERRELTTIERRLPQLHQRSQELTRALQAAGDDYRAAEETGDELAKVLQEIDAAETRWLELSEIGETA